MGGVDDKWCQTCELLTWQPSPVLNRTVTKERGRKERVDEEVAVELDLFPRQLPEVGTGVIRSILETVPSLSLEAIPAEGITRQCRKFSALVNRRRSQSHEAEGLKRPQERGVNPVVRPSELEMGLYLNPWLPRRGL